MAQKPVLQVFPLKASGVSVTIYITSELLDNSSSLSGPAKSKG